MSTSPLRRLLKHAGILLGGGAIGAALAFVSSLVAARYLGAAELGRIVLVQSLVLAVDRLVNFQSWRTVIKYGADAQERGDAADRGSVLKFGAVLDLGSALTGAALAVALTFPAARLLEWEPSTHRMAIAYGAVLVLNLTGTPTAILRMSDRFDAFVVQRAASGLTKLGGVVAAWVLDAGAIAVLAAWIAGDVVAWLVLVVAARATLRRRGEPSVWSASLRGIRSRHPGILRFALVTNAASGLRMASRQVDDFIVGVLLSETAVGLYKVAKQFALLIGVAGDPLTQAAYPDMARQVASGDRPGFVRGLRHSAAIGAAIAVPYWLLFVVAGGLVLRLTVGEEFVPAHDVLVWYTGAHALGLVGFAMPPAAMALGRPQASLVAIFLATVAYFAAVVPAIRALDLVGAGVAYLVFYAVWSAVMVGWLRAHLRTWRPGGGT